jgi:hypothetical protein
MALRWEEIAALEEQYPADHVALLLEVAELVDQVELRHLTAYEATVRLKSRFSKLMARFVPESSQRVAAYEERVAEERRKQTEQRAASDERRVRAQRAETLRLEKEAADRNAQLYANAHEAALREQEQWKQKYDEMERLRREKNEKDRLTAEAGAREGARLLTEIETSGKGK